MLCATPSAVPRLGEGRCYDLAMIDALVGLAEPFFHDRSTHNAIDEMARLENVTIFVGAGAAIERTGLTWAGMSAHLLDKDLGSYAERISIVRTIGELAAASAIERQFQKRFADEPKRALTRAIHELLYGGSQVEPSYFNERVVALANDFVGASQSVVVVTPNYDDFLLGELSNLLRDGDASFQGVDVFAFGVTADGEATTLTDEKRERLVASAADKTRITLVHVHGLEQRELHADSQPDGDQVTIVLPDEHAYPVFSEGDYVATRTNTEEILGLLFRERDIMVVGASLTDPPLLHALTERARAFHDRKCYAVRPLQGLDLSRLSDEVAASFVEVERDRASALGMNLVSPPFYFQAPQLLEEVRVALKLHRPPKGTRKRDYAGPGSSPRYGSRLESWWRAWRDDETISVPEMQSYAHSLLALAVLPVVREVLDSDEDEDMRLEAWVRWEPQSRELRLWASSTGDWPEMDMARRERIGIGANYPATTAFINGAPTYATGPTQRTRWHSFLSKPVRYMQPEEEKYGGCHIQVGVLSLSSMRSESTSSLNPRVKENAGILFNMLDAAGRALFAPEERGVMIESIARGEVTFSY